MKFVGIIPQYVPPKNSKNSSAVTSTSNSSRELKGDTNPSDCPEDCASLDHEKADSTNGDKIPGEREENRDRHMDLSEDLGGEGQVTEHLSLSSAGEHEGQPQGENAMDRLA